MRPGVDDLRVLGPDFESTWQNIFVPAPDKPVIVLAVVAG